MGPAPSFPRTPLAVALDLDGTLIDSEALVRDAYVRAAAAMGLQMSSAQFARLVGLHRDANDAQLLTLYGSDFPLEEFYARARPYLSECVAPLKPGVARLLDTLDELAVPAALVTSSGRHWVDRHFSAHGLAERFRAVVARGDYVNGKPAPEPYLKAVAALGVAPQSTVALEDSYAGVQSAHAAGLMTIMIPDLLEPDDEARGRAIFVAESLHIVSGCLRLASAGSSSGSPLRPSVRRP